MSIPEDRHANCIMNATCLKSDTCPMVLVQELMSGKRKILILWYLGGSVMRFTDLKKKLPDVTQKMLTQQLRSLEDDGLINRHVYPVVPPKVEYSLTDLGERIIPILRMMHQFGSEYIEKDLGKEVACCEPGSF